jgi:hypothetical protein
MENLVLATEQNTPPTKRTVARGKHKFIPFPSGTEKALISYDSYEPHANYRGNTTKIFTVTAPRTARITLVGVDDSAKWLEAFTAKTCRSCSKLAVPALILQQAYAADPSLITLNLDQMQSLLAEKINGTCLGVNDHVKGLCPAGHDIASGLEDQKVAVMEVPALCLVSTYVSKASSNHFAFDQERKYSLFAYKDVNQVPYVSPYRPANVHSDGKICWGHQPLPQNPKQALAAYWGSGFNRDLASQAANTLKGTLENYEQLSSNFEKLTLQTLQNFHGVNKPCVGVYLSSFKNLLTAVPPEFHIKVGSETIVLAWVLSAEPDRYLLDCKGFLVEMNDLNGRAQVKALNSSPEK